MVATRDLLWLWEFFDLFYPMLSSRQRNCRLIGSLFSVLRETCCFGGVMGEFALRSFWDKSVSQVGEYRNLESMICSGWAGGSLYGFCLLSLFALQKYFGGKRTYTKWYILHYIGR